MTKENQGFLPHTTKIFNESFVADYLSRSARNRAYEKHAINLVSLDENIGDDEVILEIGSGTGTATVVFADAINRFNPNFGMIIGLEPSGPFLNVAAYEFGKGKGILELKLPKDDTINTYIEEFKKRTENLRAKIEFIQARADGNYLPIADGSIDRIYMASAFHWLAFANEESRDISYLDNALADFQRVLKTGGKLIFDSSGLQFDANDGAYQVLNEMDHPFRVKFFEHFNQVLREKGLNPGSDITFTDMDRYYHIFNLEFLRSKLAEFGFEIVPQKNEEAYHLSAVERSGEETARRVLEGQMSYFHALHLKDLQDKEKQALIEITYQRTRQDADSGLDIPGAEIMVGFVFKKI